MRPRAHLYVHGNGKRRRVYSIKDDGIRVYESNQLTFWQVDAIERMEIHVPALAVGLKGNCRYYLIDFKSSEPIDFESMQCET
jgi:hypothetical protein